MPFHHFLLALLVALIWGMNFIFLKLALTEIPPLFLCALRFFLSSIPAIFFIRIPNIPFKKIATYGLVMFALQFGLLFIGMNFGMMAGMASLIAQMQVFFSIFFAYLWLSEVPNGSQILGSIISFCGIFVVGMHFDNESVSLIGFVLILSAALTWGIGNTMTRQMKHINMLGLIVWGSFIAAFPLLILSFLFEGKSAIENTLTTTTITGFGSLLYIVYASTWIGYGTWNFLVSRYPVSVIAPFTLLVPITAMLGSILFLGEKLTDWKILACFLVITGLCISLLGKRFSEKMIMLSKGR